MTGQYRDFAFTIFHHDHPGWSPDLINRDKINFFAGQEEICPSTGNKHWQCTAQAEKRCGYKKFEIAIGLPRKEPKKPAFHCQKVWSTITKSAEYCLKEESRAPDGLRITFGEITSAKSIWDYVKKDILKGCKLDELKDHYAELCVKYASGLTALYSAVKPRPKKAAPENWHPWQQEIIDLTAEPCNGDRTIHWYWEPNGNVGKSRLALWLHDHRNAFLCNNAKSADIAYAWDDNPIAVFDFARTTEEKINWGILEQISNEYLFSSKYQSGGKRFARPHIICFANYPPNFNAMSKDRWNVVNILEPSLMSDSSPSAPPPIYRGRAPDNVVLSNGDIDEILDDLVISEGKGAPSSQTASNAATHSPTGSGNNDSDPVPSTPLRDCAKRAKPKAGKHRLTKNLRIRQNSPPKKMIPAQAQDHRVDRPNADSTTARASHGPC